MTAVMVVHSTPLLEMEKTLEQDKQKLFRLSRHLGKQPQRICPLDSMVCAAAEIPALQKVSKQFGKHDAL